MSKDWKEDYEKLLMSATAYSGSKGTGKKTISASSIDKENYMLMVQFNHEKAEQEKLVKVAELKEMVLKGGFVKESELETSEELKAMLESCNEDALKIFRAERILASVETSTETKVKKEKKEFSEADSVKKNFMDEFLYGENFR